MQFKKLHQDQIDMNAFGSGNLSSIHLAFRHLIDFLTVQHQVGCKSIRLIKTDLLICNRQRFIIIIKYTQEGVMAVSYNRLWKLLVDRKMSKADLRKASGVAPNTMTKLRRDEEVTLTVLGKICSTLNVDYGDIMEYIDERDDEEHDPGRKGASCD